jgi:hypothetical protein
MLSKYADWVAAFTVLIMSPFAFAAADRLLAL